MLRNILIYLLGFCIGVLCVVTIWFEVVCGQVQRVCKKIIYEINGEEKP